jgi:murein L,D-transpeptidase YcbB/YkuD
MSVNEGVAFAPEASSELKEAHAVESFATAVEAALVATGLEPSRDHPLFPVPERAHVPEDASPEVRAEAEKKNAEADRIESMNEESSRANASRAAARIELTARVRAKLPPSASSESKETHVLEGDSVNFAARAAEAFQARQKKIAAERESAAQALADRLAKLDPAEFQAELTKASRATDGPAVVKLALAKLGVSV